MPPPPDHAGTADSWTAHDQFIDELVERSRTSTSPAAFYRELLDRVVEGLAARSAAVWERRDGAACLRLLRDDAGHFDADDRSPRLSALRPAAAWALEHCEALALPPSRAGDADGLPPNSGDWLLLVQPIVLDDEPVAAIAVEQRPDLDPEARRGALRFLATVGELAADFERNHQRMLFRRRANEAEDLEKLLAALYADTEAGRVAFAAANEGCRWCGADRVSVVLLEGKSSRVAATTGVDEVDRRAEAVRKLERLVAQAAEQRTALRYPDAANPPPPQLAEVLADYVETAEPKGLEIKLLRRREAEPPSAPHESDDAGDGRVFAALVVEQFGSESTAPLPERVELLQRHAATALRNALDVERIPFGRAWLAWRKRRGVYARRLGRAALVVAALVVTGASTFLIPARLKIDAAGTMRPRERRDVYAPFESVVDEVLVRHGDVVAAGAPLVRLRRPDLDLEQARVAGELQTAQRRLAALRSTRTSSAATDAADRRRRQELAAEEEQLKETVAAAERQLELLAKQQRELTVRAPLAGRVTTWDPEALLAGRPVGHGRRLLHVADEQGAWELALRIPQAGFHEVRAAHAASAVDVEFVVATGPEQTYAARLSELSQGAETDAAGGARVAAAAEFDPTTVPADIRRSGAIVSARIDCGPSSLGAVWSRDLLHYLRTRWWF